MSSAWSKTDWIARIIGGVVVAGGAFLTLLVWNTWDLTMTVRIAVSVGFGVLFVFFGGDAIKWIGKIDRWS